MRLPQPFVDWQVLYTAVPHINLCDLDKFVGNQIIRFMKDHDKKNLRRKLKAQPKRRAVRSVKGSRVISATEASRAFSELLDRVYYRGETFVIERGGEPVCQMSHVKPLKFTGADFLTLLHSLPKPDPGFWDAVNDATKQRPTVPESPWES